MTCTIAINGDTYTISYGSFDSESKDSYTIYHLKNFTSHPNLDIRAEKHFTGKIQIRYADQVGFKAASEAYIKELGSTVIVKFK